MKILYTLSLIISALIIHRLAPLLASDFLRLAPLLIITLLLSAHSIRQLLTK